MTNEEIVFHIKKYIEKNSQKSLAEKMGLSTSYINDVLKGRRIVGLKRAYQLADALNIHRFIIIEAILNKKLKEANIPYKAIVEKLSAKERN